PPVDSGLPVLMLGDLGFLADASRHGLWASLGEQVRRAGALPTALVPAPPSRFKGGLGHRWDSLSWERPGRAAEPGRPLQDEERLARAERLLSLVSFAGRFDPGLLRAVRRLLPAQEADAGTEADAWNHPEVAGGFTAAASPSPELRRRLQKQFVTEGSELKGRVVATMRAWRAGEPSEIWLDEVLGLSAAGLVPKGALFPEEVEAAESLWKRIAETLGGGASPVVDSAIRDYVHRAVRERFPDSAWGDERWSPLLARAWGAAWQGEGPPPLPAGVGPEILPPGGE